MSTNDLIRAALVNPNHTGITIYWDKQDPDNVGPAWRTADDSGAMEFVRWTAADPRNAASDVVEGYSLESYFGGPDGAYLGPDQHGVYPVLIDA